MKTANHVPQEFLCIILFKGAKLGTLFANSLLEVKQGNRLKIHMFLSKNGL